MRNASKWIWIAIVVIVLVIWWPKSWPSIPGFGIDFGSDTNTEQYEHDIDSLKKIVQNYEDENAQLGLRLNELQDEIYDLQSTVRRRENTIANLKKETNETINIVSRYTTSDIYKFLSDRYKDSTIVK